jgi:hypothetical protein
LRHCIGHIAFDLAKLKKKKNYLSVISSTRLPSGDDASENVGSSTIDNGGRGRCGTTNWTVVSSGFLPCPPTTFFFVLQGMGTVDTDADAVGAGLFEPTVLGFSPAFGPFVLDGAVEDALNDVLSCGAVKTGRRREVIGFGGIAVLAGGSGGRSGWTEKGSMAGIRLATA